jgi:hypothetical protein
MLALTPTEHVGLALALGTRDLEALRALLRDRGVTFAMIGAARSTRELDLLALDRRCLTPAFWAVLRAGGTDVTARDGGFS